MDNPTETGGLTTNVLNDSVWVELINGFVDGTALISDDAPRAVKDAERYSDRTRLCRMLCEAGAKHAQAKGYSPTSRETREILNSALDFASQLSASYFDWERLRQAENNFVNEAESATEVRAALQMGRIRSPHFGAASKWQELKTSLPRMPTSAELDERVMEYIESPFRSKVADRLLLRLLLECELTAFLHQMLRPDALDKKNRSELEKANKVLRTTGIGRALQSAALATLAIITLIFLSLVLPQYANEILLFGLPVVLLTFIGFVLGVIYAFSFYVPKQKENARRLVEQVTLGMTALEALKGDGPLSVSETRRWVDILRDHDFILPQTLIGLLDMLDEERTKIV